MTNTQQDLILVKNNNVITTSLKIARGFDKKHSNILRDIKNLECSEEFNRLNFELVKYRDSKGELRPYYEVTRDGFMILTMGFTGKKAMTCKEQFISLFNKMGNKLIELRNKNSIQLLTDKEKMVLLATQVLESEKEITKLNDVITELEPKAIFHDTVIASKEWIPLFKFGKIVEIGPKNIFTRLYDLGYLYWNDGQRVPKEKYKKYLKLKNLPVTYENGERHIKQKVYISPEGQAYFTNLLIPSGQLLLEAK